MAKWALANADAVVGVSSFVAQSAVSGGRDPGGVHTLLNGIEPDRWDPAIDGSAIRGEFGVPTDVPLIGVVSRLFSWKGHTQLLQGLALLKQRGTPFRLLIVGEDDIRGQPGQTRYSEELAGLVSELRLQEQVIFTGFRSDVPQIMAAIDIYAMPSFEEPLGVVYLEAMAMKKPVVALDSGGVPEVVVDGVTGYLTKPGDIRQLAIKIDALASDPDLRRRMGESGRLRVERELNANLMTARMESIYQTIVNGRESVGMERSSPVATARG